MLIIVFGEMGMGKNFVGECLAEECGFHFFDGDSAITLGKKGLLHKSDVDHFVKNQLIPAIDTALRLHKNVVVAQALYFQEHREQIYQHFRYLTSVKFVHVNATEELQKNRLLGRESAESFWLPYAARSHRHFQAPLPSDDKYMVIQNNKNKEAIVEQIKALSLMSDVKEAKPVEVILKRNYAI